MATLQAPYLRAIQSVPGDTPAEKFRWISRLISKRFQAHGESVEIAESEEIPQPLMPLVKVEAAKMLKQCEGIVEALKSDDSVIVNRALQASWFFDGSNRDIVNVEYFAKNLFPFVSLKTRGKILKSMAAHLKGQKADVAEEFFLAIVQMYGIEQAFPLLAECSENFIYDTVVERDLILPRKVLKKLFKKNPDLVVRYFKLSKPEDGKKNTYLQAIHANSDFLAKLVKQRLQAFLELYEMHEKNPPACKLSNKCAYYFLKNAKESLTRKPILYMRIVPLKLIDAKRMEIILPKLFPAKKRAFDVNRMIAYLAYYPEDQKANLLIKSYKQVYDDNLLDHVEYITHELMSILPFDERVRLAKIKLEKDGPYKKIPYVHVNIPWELYLPIETVIPEIKREIAQTSSVDDRYTLLMRLFFACKINKDNNTLLSILDYYRNRHKNEQAWVKQGILDLLVENFELHKLSEAHWEILYDIIRRAYVKNELPPGRRGTRILEAAIHFRLNHKMPIDQPIDMAVDCMAQAAQWDRNWELLTEYPEYDRICLDACLAVVEKKIDVTESWKKDKTYIVLNLFSSMCHFNQEYVKPNNKIERLTLKNCPWLLQRLERLAKSDNSYDHDVKCRLKDLLPKFEKEYFLSWFPEDNVIADVTTGNALARLKKDPQSILDNYKLYLEKCRDWHHQKNVWHFLRAMRWYKDVGIKFAEECLNDVRQGEKPGALFLLALLLHGNVYTQLIEPFIPDVKTIEVQSDDAKTNYSFIVYISMGIKVANPPVPLELIGKLCGGDYMSRALVALTNVSRRTSLTKVIPFATSLTSERVSVKKHGIRLVCLVASLQEKVTFLSSMWKQETHPSIREVLYQMAENLFFSNPQPATWDVIKHLISNLTNKDEALLVCVSKINRVPRGYLADYVNLVLDLIDNLPAIEFNEAQIKDCQDRFITALNGEICNTLPHESCYRILKLCFNTGPIKKSTGVFVNVFLLSSENEEILKQRLTSLFELLTVAIRTQWDVQHPKYFNYYPMNCGVNELLSDIFYGFTYKQKKEKEKLIVDEFMKMFLNELSPAVDPNSYLLLLLTQLRFNSADPREFGSKVGADFPRLMNIFSAAFFIVVGSAIRKFLQRNVFANLDEDEIKMGFREGMADVGNIDALVFVAAEPPFSIKTDEMKERYEALVKRIRDVNHPAVKSAFAYRINSFECGTDNFL